jgi:predicted helicase
MSETILSEDPAEVKVILEKFNNFLDGLKEGTQKAISLKDLAILNNIKNHLDSIPFLATIFKEKDMMKR